MDHATRKSKKVNNLTEARQQNADNFAYIIRIQKLNNIDIWVYTPCGEGKVEMFKPVDDFDKDRQYARILVWENAGVEHCALIKTETLIDRPNKMNYKHYYCYRCTYWFNSQIQYGNTNVVTLLDPRLFVPRRKKFSFLNEHKRQNIKNIITADIECCVVNVTTNSNKYVIAEHIPIIVGYTSQSNFKY